MKSKLIVNADDFGLAPCITEGIELAHRNGIVTSASLLAVGETFEFACRVAERNPKLDIGIHLCLDEEKPVSLIEKIPTLVNGKGYFLRRGQMIQRLLSWRIDPNQVRYEWERQIKKALNQGLTLTHMDSHGHVHCLPPLLPIAFDLANKYNIQYLRVPIESGRLGLTIKNSLVAVSYLAGLFLTRRKGCLQKRADFFMGMKFGGYLNEANLLTLLRQINRPGVYEIMCHPGASHKKELQRWQHWRYHWEEELAALQSQRVKEFVKENNIQLQTINDRERKEK